MKQAICKICKKEFTPRINNLGMYCSNACKFEGQRKGKMEKCDQCGKESWIAPSTRAQTKNHFCSELCANTFKKGKPNLKRRTGQEVPCAVCGKAKWVYQCWQKRNQKQYCSKECLAKGKITAEVIDCKVCGKEVRKFKSQILRGEKCCSVKCSAISHRSKDFDPIGRSLDKGKKWAKAVKERDGFKCTRCNATQKLHAHHVLTWKDYPEERFNIKNGITLCVDCHIDIHSNRIINN